MDIAVANAAAAVVLDEDKATIQSARVLYRRGRANAPARRRRGGRTRGQSHR